MSERFEGYTRDQITLIKNTVARGATDDELALFLHYCKTSGLDPLRKQATFQIRKTRCPVCHGSGCSQCDRGYIRTPTFIAGIDGLLARASQFPNFGGIQAAEVHEKDDFEFDALEGRPVKHKYGAQRGPLIGAWATVYFKDGRKPMSAWYSLAEYMAVVGDNPQVAGKAPGLMLVKAVQSIVLRRAFPDPFSGVYTNEEFGNALPAPAPNPELKEPEIDESPAETSGEAEAPASADAQSKPIEQKEDVKEKADSRAGWEYTPKDSKGKVTRKYERPMPPDILPIAIKEAAEIYEKKGVKVKDRKAIYAGIKEIMKSMPVLPHTENLNNAADQFLTYLVGTDDIDTLTDGQAEALITWLGQDYMWHPSEIAIREGREFWLDLFGPMPGADDETEQEIETPEDDKNFDND